MSAQFESLDDEVIFIIGRSITPISRDAIFERAALADDYFELCGILDRLVAESRIQPAGIIGDTPSFILAPGRRAIARPEPSAEKIADAMIRKARADLEGGIRWRFDREGNLTVFGEDGVAIKINAANARRLADNIKLNAASRRAQQSIGGRA